MKEIKCIILGIVCSVVCTIVLLLCFSIILVNNSINENTISICIILFYILAILIGSIITTRKIKIRGALYGFLMTFIYISSLYIISSIYIGDFSFSIQSAGIALLGLVVGTIGGITGVNIK